MIEKYGKYTAQLILVGVVYFFTGKYGLMLDAVSGQASFIWPPTGIALAAVLLGGLRIWPAILVAAFCVNYIQIGTPIPACIGIAIGNTLEALVAGLLLTHFVNIDRRLNRIGDVARLFGYGAILSTLVSATIGVSSIYLAGKSSLEGFGTTWTAWWLGDMLGDLVIAPLILVGARFRPNRVSASRLAEGLLLLAGIGGAALLLFGDFDGAFAPLVRPFPFILFPFVTWASLRFGQLGNVLTVFTICAAAVWSTIHGVGPFAQTSLRGSIFSLLSFMVVFSVTGSFLAAAIEEIRTNLAEKAYLFHKAQASVRTRDEFLSIASHELKTPLTSLNLQLDLAKSKLGQDAAITRDMIGLNQAFDLLFRQTRRLTNLVDDLLDVSHINTGRFSFDLRPTNLSSVIRDTASRYSHQLAKADCKLQLDIEEPVSGDFDILRIGQLLENLLANAAKYAPKSSIAVSLKKKPGAAVLVVADNGPGIPKEKQARLFERFERANTDRGVSGLGLGLFIVREIVKGHNGKVSLDSDTGRGTRFVVDLPLSPVS